MEPLPETREALAELVSIEEPQLDELFYDLGRRARAVVPELVGLSLGLRAEGVTFTLIATGAGVAAMDAAQYLSGGPCVEVTEGRSAALAVDVTDPLDEQRWQLFAQVTAAAGIASSLSLPLYREQRLVGGVNLYASTSGAFEGRTDQLAVLLGARSAEAVTNADLSFSTRLDAIAAPRRLRERADIETAVGLLAGLRGLGIEAAFELLREAAARAGVSEPLLARVLIISLRPGG